LPGQGTCTADASRNRTGMHGSPLPNRGRVAAPSGARPLFGIPTMHTLIHRLDALAERLARFLAILAGIFLVSAMLLACANMLLRAVHVPIQGTVELVGFFGAVLTAFSLGLAQRRRGHIFVGLLTTKLPPALQRASDALQLLASCAFFTLAGVETARWGLDLIHSGELSQTLRLAYHPFVFAAALGCLAMAFVLFVDFLKTLPGAPGPTPEG